MKYLASFVIVILIGMLTNTVVRYSEKFLSTINSLRGNELKANNNSTLQPSWEAELEEAVFLNSISKWYSWLFILALCILLVIDNPAKFNTENNLVTTGLLVVILIVFLGISLFLHKSDFNGFDKWNMYFLKLIVLLIFTIVGLDSYVETTTSISSLVISIGIPIIFSFLIMKSVIDSFKSYLFQAFNFVVLILFFNLFVIGYTFGLYYGFNNGSFVSSSGEYIFYKTEEIELLSKNTWGLEEFLLITYEGIRPFYSFIEINTDNGVIGYIPFFEFILGNIYNLTVIAFFISYSVSKLINRQELKNKCCENFITKEPGNEYEID